MTEQVQDNAAATAQAEKPKLSRREKLTQQYTSKYAKYEELLGELKSIKEELDAITALENVGPGSAVVVSIGKGETAKEVDGLVLAVKDDEDGQRSYKVQYGTGFDTDIVVVKAGKLKLPAAAEAAAPAQGDQFFNS